MKTIARLSTRHTPVASNVVLALYDSRVYSENSAYACPPKDSFLARAFAEGCPRIGA